MTTFILLYDSQALSGMWGWNKVKKIVHLSSETFQFSKEIQLQKFAKDLQYRKRCIVLVCTFYGFLFFNEMYQCTYTIDDQYGTLLINYIKTSTLLIN